VPCVYIGVGTNRGPRERNIRQGLQLLAERGFRIMKQSPIYETEPVNMPGAGMFLNAAVSAETNLAPRDCLAALKAIERQLGRPSRHPRNSPRVLDLDLLLYNASVIGQSGFVVPHPELHKRAFVLVPLADIAPGLIHPVLRRRVSTLLKTVGRDGVRRWGGR
jgi:2-amino-4-hydroxy-6-hydroxymethyldihydropteridine diphosphokinase